MQNFTLGKNGYSMFLFALILLIGSSPTFGQTNCPTVTDSSQDFCALATVSNLQATPNGDGLQWFDDQTSTDPIPSNEILEDNKIYFAGNNSNSCTGSRQTVTANVTDVGPPELAPGEDEFFTPCQRTAGNPNNNDIGTLKAGIEFNPVPGFRIEYYADEFDQNSPILPDNTELVSGTSYFAGFVGNDVSDCQTSSRTAIRYEPIVVPAPTAEPVQTVCPGTTVGELEASGTNRWYRTATSEPPLPNSTVLEDGKVYYATQIIPSDGPPCESKERTAVGVIIANPDAGDDNTDNTLCLSEAQAMFTSVQAARNYFTDLIESGINTDGNFDPTIESLATDFSNNPIGIFQTTYSVGPEECPDSAILAVTITDDPNAGADNTNNSFCEDQALSILSNETDATAFYMSLIDANADSGGSFDPEISTIVDDFNNNGPTGTYQTEYVVKNGATCEDRATLSVTVQDGNGDAGADNTGTILCEAEARAMFPSVSSVRNFYLNLLDDSTPTNGTFDPTIQQLVDQFIDNPIGDFQTTYTLGTDQCQDSALLSIGVEANETANAGNIEDLPNVCSNDPDIDLFTLLDSNATRSGTFSGYPSGTFSPSTEGAGSYTITYTVDGSSDPCVNGTSSETFSITVQQAPFAGPSVTKTFCITEFQDLINTPQDAIDLFNSLLDPNAATGGVFSPTINSLVLQYTINPIGTFSSTYTVSNGQCEDKAEITVIIQDREDANAGGDINLTFCTSDDDIVLTDYLTNDASKNGSFEGYPNGIFSPASLGAGTYTFKYNVDETSGECIDGSDSSTFTIEVNQGVSAGADKNRTLCRAQINQIISEGTARNYYLGLLDAGVPRNGTFNPTIQSLVDRYNNDGQIGTFTSTYTVENNSCSDSSEISVTVVANSSANAGDDITLTFCSTEGEQNLFDFLSNGADTTGSFEGYPNGEFNPEENIGTTTIIYTVNTTGSPCTSGSDTSTFTITVNEPQDANAGGPVEANYCVEQDLEIDLKAILGEGAITTGSFSAPFEDGLFNPSEAGIGEFSITYTLNGSEDCAIGTDTATITITVTDLPDAPTADANQSFCLADGPTVGDIVVTGSNVVIYTNSDLTDEADATTTLVNGMSYYATSTSEGETCSSDAIEITVTITDPAAPSLSLDGNEFCRSDNPTVQALVNNFSGGVVIYNASTGGTSIQANTPLQNGTTYYAAAINATSGCESSERTAVIAKVEFCGIPEGFSPNGDGINDRFVIPDIAENFPNYTIEIFNRWGQVVFKGNSSTPDWDGISNQSGTLGNDVLPVGVYFYILNYNDGQTSPVQGKLYLSI